jgi:hypothetical protein
MNMQLTPSVQLLGEVKGLVHLQVVYSDAKISLEMKDLRSRVDLAIHFLQNSC